LPMKKLGIVALLASGAVILTSCDGFRGASQYTKRVAFDAAFEQRALVEEEVDPNRVLTMYVFRKGSGAQRNGYAVRFNAGAD
ncbi:MAG: hypothetical protein AAF557_28045, partial [Pseudomonadota bacterium]